MKKKRKTIDAVIRLTNRKLLTSVFGYHVLSVGKSRSAAREHLNIMWAQEIQIRQLPIAGSRRECADKIERNIFQ